MQGTKGVGRQIEEQISLFDKPVILLSVNPVSYQECVLGALKYFSERFGMGLYITLNKPTAVLRSHLQNSGVPLGSLVFLDSVTNTQEQETDACWFLGRMRELADLSIAVSKVVSKRDQIKYVLFDSVSTLLIYNDPKSVARFCHLIAEKLRGWGISGAFISMQLSEGTDMDAQISQFCDAFVKGDLA